MSFTFGDEKLARLDKKTGTKVFCGRENCRGQFGTIAQTLESGRGATHRSLIMDPGWRQEDDGVWRLRRWEAARQRDVRRKLGAEAISVYQATEEAAPKLRSAYATNADREQGLTEGFHRGTTVTPPLDAECPVCRSRNRLDAEALQLIGKK